MNIILIIIISCLYIYVTFVSTSYLESELGRAGGFFPMLFVTFNHALYAKENNMNFRINSADWLYEYRDGWDDYFLPYEVNNHTQIFHLVKGYPVILEDFSIEDYKRIIPLIYRYNEKTRAFIKSAGADLGLLSESYDSLCLAQGINVEKYVDLLLEKNPAAKLVYVETHDYDVVEKIREYISKKQKVLEIKSLCDRSLKRAVEEMSPQEVYDYTVKLIAGVDFMAKSNICICDYADGMGRFVKLFHNDVSRVYDPQQEVDYKRVVCPAFSF